MIAPDINIAVPVEDLKRRFIFMLQQEGGNFENLFKGFTSLADVLDLPFAKLQLYHRLKETIRFSTHAHLRTVEHYLRHVVYNHTQPVNFQESDFELVIFYNSQLVKFLKKKFPAEYKILLETVDRDLQHVFWFDKAIPFWVKDNYMEVDTDSKSV